MPKRPMKAFILHCKKKIHPAKCILLSKEITNHNQLINRGNTELPLRRAPQHTCFNLKELNKNPLPSELTITMNT